MSHMLRSLATTLPLLLTVSVTFAQPRGGPAVTSPEVHSDGRVTFRVAAPAATVVQLTGDWPGGPIDMARDAAGVWSATVGPLKPEMYGYTFTVNGVRALDGRTPNFRRDGTRFEHVLILPGPQSSLYQVNDVPHGTVAQVWYQSPSLKMTRRMYVYTPPGYESGSARYPVLYLLHGSGGDEDAWSSNGRAPQILDNLIAQGKARPMIVVMTNGNTNQAASPDVAVPQPLPPAAARAPEGQPEPAARGQFYVGAFADSLVNDVVPYIEAHYRVLAGRENRAIAGLSMGGAQATYAGLRNMDKFAWVGCFSGALVLWPGAMRPIPAVPGSTRLGQGLDLPTVAKVFPDLNAKTGAGLRLLYVSVGSEDGLIEANHQFKGWLREKGVPFVDIESPGYAHVWSLWRINLTEFASRLFQAK